MFRTKLRVGDVAPDFNVTTADGTELRLSAFRGHKNVVLFFYPKDFTAGCTAEACSFRDIYDDLLNKDTEVIGISLDDSTSHRSFADRYGLKFPLVSDPGGTMARAYGAMGPVGALLGAARRMTFVIGKDGIIRGIFHHELAIKKHVEDVQASLAHCA